MGKSITFIIVTVAFLATGCPEKMVGAPCVSETDNKKFSTELLSESDVATAMTWSIETGSVQCATNLCLTQTKVNKDAEAKIKECQDDPSEQTCGADISNGDVKGEPVILKFSFCSCRCKDGDDNSYADNPDKFGDLCECPPSAKCVKVLDKIGGTGDSKDDNESGGSAISEKLFGSYCVPACIDTPCYNQNSSDEKGEVCTPSTNSEEPWLWSCEKLTR
ncbi:MAG: hypothetical protein JXR76_24215 [Deltaproteobacteria bacterium]|nr:hypothetical protein [Deltaproteobacteria bacterium]